MQSGGSGSSSSSSSGTHHKINWANFNYAGTGVTNTGYTPHNLNPNAIPHQNHNTWSDPSGAAPNFVSSANGAISVDTASLTAFSQWISKSFGDANSGPLATLIKQLDSISVQPGSFYYAGQLRASVNGTGKGTGLKSQFVTVLTDLLDGLADISNGLNQLVQLYGNTEDLNSAKAQKLEGDMSNSFSRASGEFNTLGSAAQPSSSSSQSGS
jgi:hypothetical protein